MKVVFLDIDGVLNSHLRNETFLPGCVELLNHITESTGAKIVASTTWRIYRSVLELKTTLKENGVKATLVAFTPWLVYTGATKYDEIHSYLLSRHDIEQYVILDDEMIAQYHEHFVQTDGNKGLQPRDVKIAIDVLNGKFGRFSIPGL